MIFIWVCYGLLVFVKIEGEMQKKKKKINFILLFSLYLFVLSDCLVLEKTAQGLDFFTVLLDMDA